MRMLCKCNSKYFLTMCLVVILSGCASQNQPATQSLAQVQSENKSDNATAAENASTENVSKDSALTDNLSAQTVAPVGFKKFMGIFTPYRITIQQGNFVSLEMADQIKEGLTREQVRFILGTALLTDMFHADRWDYIFRLLKPSGELITSRVTVHFHQSLVSKIERGNLPNEQEYLARITSAAN